MKIIFSDFEYHGDYYTSFPIEIDIESRDICSLPWERLQDIVLESLARGDPLVEAQRLQALCDRYGDPMIYSALRRAGIVSIADLRRYDPAQVPRIRGIGAKRQAIVQRMIENLNKEDDS